MEMQFNLLPEERKKKIQRSNILRFVVWQEIVIIFIVMFFFLTIQSIDFIVNLRLEEAKQQISMLKNGDNYRQAEKYEKYLNSFNKKMRQIEKAQVNSTDWTDVFDKINNLIPSVVVIDSIKGDKNSISIKGVAPLRDDLIEMKKNFSDDDCFEDVNIPLNDIVLKKDIDFEVDFKIKRKCLFK